MEGALLAPHEAPAPLGGSGSDDPEPPSRTHLEVGFAVGALLACIIIGAFLLNVEPGQTPRPDDVLRPQPVATGTYAPAPIVRDTFRAVSPPSATVSAAPFATPPAASSSTGAGQGPAIAHRPTTAPHPRPTSRATPRATPTPTRTIPAAPAPVDHCIISVLGIRVCLP